MIFNKKKLQNHYFYSILMKILRSVTVTKWLLISVPKKAKKC